MIIFSCGAARLNGVYYIDPEVTTGPSDGIVWSSWLGGGYSVKSSTMILIRNI